MHYPDRVMRQFGLYQTVPPPPPLDYSFVRNLRKNRHSANTGQCDWGDLFRAYINAEPEPITETRSYAYAEHFIYMGWYSRRGMHTIWYQQNNEQVLSQPLEMPDQSTQTIETLGYVPIGPRTSRVVSNLSPLTFYNSTKLCFI
jgi:hypothetical protein